MLVRVRFLRRHSWLNFLGVFVVWGMTANLVAENVVLTISAGEHDRHNAPIRVTLEVPDELWTANSFVLSSENGDEIPAQIGELGLLAMHRRSEASGMLEQLHFILPDLKAGQSTKLTLRGSDAETAGFSWDGTPDVSRELQHGDRPVLRYMYEALDESSPERREETYKVFHHLFDPTGSRLVTKGPGGRYTHHRGLFYGFNRITYGDGIKADIWHCTGNVHQSHEEFLLSEAGPVMGRHRLAIDWNGQDKQPFAKEQRELTVYHVPGGQMVEFASVLKPTDGPVRLDGDPQHAGFHFRASNEVADSTNSETYYLRPDGKGETGATRNWPNQRGHVNLPWNCMSFVMGDARYTAVYLDRPDNPKEARFSERDYGRFGSYFEYDLSEENPLVVNYRVWLQEGEITAETARRLSLDFVEPVQVEVSWE